MKLFRFGILLFAIIALTATHTLAADEFMIINRFGGLGAVPPSSGLTGINNYGQVVGESSIRYGEDYASRAFLLTPEIADGTAIYYKDDNDDDVNDLMVEFGTLGGRHSRALGLNDSGQVVGFARDVNDRNFPVLWSGGQTIILDHRDNQGYAEAINSSGLVAGLLIWATFWSEAGVTELNEDIIGQNWSVPYDLNDNGQMVGVVDYLGSSWREIAFLWDGVTFTTLGPLTGEVGDISEAYGINNAGQVVGYSDASNDYHATLWDGETITDLGTLPGGTESYAVGINNIGQVVGWSATDGEDEEHAFLYLPAPAYGLTAGMHDLNNLVPEGSLLLEDGIIDINDNGLILFDYFILVPNDYVPIPVPVPKTTTANYNTSGTSDDPINTYTGELFKQYPPDINLGGPKSLYFVRYYASSLLSANISGSMGGNWRHNFEWTLTNTGTDISIVNHKGRFIQFTQNESTWDLTGKTDIVYQLDETAGVFTLLDPCNRHMYTFNASGQLSQIEDGRGNMHTLTYDTGDNLADVSDGLGRTLTFTYDTDKLSAVTDGTRTVSFAHTGNDLTQVTDALGNITTYAYDTGSLMTSSTQPAGNTPYSQTWNESGQVDSQTDSDGHTTTFTYVEPDTTITDALGVSRVHTHTATGELNNSQDQTGSSVSIGSDTTGRRNSVTDRLGDTTSYVHHEASGKLASTTNADGTNSGFSYTARDSGSATQYDLTGITNADGTTEGYAHDANGNLTLHTDRLGNASGATYNGNGQPLTSTNTAGGVTTYTYNADGTLATCMDPAGNTTTFGYDALKRPNQITFDDGSTQQFAYDAEDRQLSSIDENGNTITFSYDPNGNLETVTDPLNSTTTFTYDGNDRLISATGPLGGIVSTTYDALGRRETATDENNNTTYNSYDTLGRLTTVTRPKGNSKSYTYDAEGVIASTSDGLGNTTTFISDKMGRVIQTTSPTGNTNQIGYDQMGRVTSTTDPLMQTTSFNYDSRGLLIGIDLPGGVISTTYTRNSLGNITQITDPNDNDWHSSFNNQGLRTSRTDPLNNIKTTTYDNRNRPATITYADSVIQTLGYDSADNLTSRSYSGGGPVFNFSYDGNNRLISANDGPATPDNLTQSYDDAGRISNSNGVAISRDTSGRITSIELAESKTVTYGYDVNDNLISVTDWTDMANNTTTFTYNANDRMLSIIRPTANGVNTNYSYDNDGRLVGVNESRGAITVSSITLVHDANGQVTQATRNMPQPASARGLNSQSNSFDAASQIATSGFVYDASGRLIDDGTKTLSWDAASRLSSVTEGATTTTYTYDSLGQRLLRSSGGVDRSFVWNTALDLSTISIERDGAGNDLRYFIHTPTGALLYSIDAVSNARRFYHFDEMGNTIAVTDDSGTVIGSYAYTPYGKCMASTGALDNPFTWQGKSGVMDEGNGLYCVRARYYDSVTGRFISRDPVRSINPKGVNPYQYAFGNPMKFSDPLGLHNLDDEYNKGWEGKYEKGMESLKDVAFDFFKDQAVDKIEDKHGNFGADFMPSDENKDNPGAAMVQIAQGLLKMKLDQLSDMSKKKIGQKIVKGAKLAELGIKIGLIIYNEHTKLQAHMGRVEVEIFHIKRNADALSRAKQVITDMDLNDDTDVNKLSSMDPQSRSILRTIALERLHKIQKKMLNSNLDSWGLSIYKDRWWFLLNAVSGDLVMGEAGWEPPAEPTSDRGAAQEPTRPK